MTAAVSSKQQKQGSPVHAGLFCCCLPAGSLLVTEKKNACICFKREAIRNGRLKKGTWFINTVFWGLFGEKRKSKETEQFGGNSIRKICFRHILPLSINA